MGEQDQKRYDVAMGDRLKGSQVREMRGTHDQKGSNVYKTYQSLQDHKDAGGTLAEQPRGR